MKDSRIYEILDELQMSPQKAHQDYANADQFGEEKNGAALNNTDDCCDSQINQKRLPHFSKPGLGDPKEQKVFVETLKKTT